MRGKKKRLKKYAGICDFFLKFINLKKEKRQQQYNIQQNAIP